MAGQRHSGCAPPSLAYLLSCCFDIKHLKPACSMTMWASQTSPTYLQDLSTAFPDFWVEVRCAVLCTLCCAALCRDVADAPHGCAAMLPRAARAAAAHGRRFMVAHSFCFLGPQDRNVCPDLLAAHRRTTAPAD